jgi:hypothetical protein
MALIEHAPSDCAPRSAEYEDSMIAAVKAAMPDVDPYVLAGALIEAIAVTVATYVPPECRGETAVDCLRMLRDRLRANRAI